MIKTIIFDIGNVLVDYNWRAALDTFPYSQETKEAISTAMFLSPEWNEFDRGTYSTEEMLALFIKNAPEYQSEIESVFASIGRCIHQFEYAIPWICALKKEGLNVYVLSNYAEHMYNQTQDELNFLKYTDGGILSFREKMVKPEPAIYRTLMERYRIEPDEAVFIDDYFENVEDAKKLGLHGILFTSYEDTVEKLAELGVVTR